MGTHFVSSSYRYPVAWRSFLEEAPLPHELQALAVPCVWGGSGHLGVPWAGFSVLSQDPCLGDSKGDDRTAYLAPEGVASPASYSAFVGFI